MDLGYVSVRPRKSLEIPVILGCTEKKNKKKQKNKQTNSVCYFPREDTWCRLHDYSLDSFTVLPWENIIDFLTLSLSGNASLSEREGPGTLVCACSR